MAELYELRFRNQALTLHELEAFHEDGLDDIRMIYGKVQFLTPNQVRKVMNFVDELLTESNKAKEVPHAQG